MKQAVYFELKHKKHNRAIYFRDTPQAIRFIRPKFRHSWKKKILFFLIAMGIHKFVCKRHILPSNFGEVVYVANSVKSFDLKNKCVYTFMDNKEKMIKKVKQQNYLAKNGFAAKILGVSNNNYYKEELLYDCKYSDIKIFQKLREFHKFTKFKYIHGDFVRDHIKVDKEGEIKFIDWMIRKGKPIEDINNFIRKSQ